MQRTVLMALTLGLLTVAPAVGAAGLFKTDTPIVAGEKVLGDEGVGVLAPLGCSLGGGQTPLVDGVSVTGTLTTQVGANCEFVYTPALNRDGAKFVMAPATSDFDLYIKKGAVPTTSVYDCRPFSGGINVETCLAEVTDATPIYVMVRRFSGSGDFTVTASEIALNPLCPAGNNALGASAAHRTPIAVGAACYYVLTPGAGDDLVRFTATPEGAAFGLYVKRGAVPTTTSADCIQGASFLVRVCEVVADGQDIYVMVRRSTAVGLGQYSLATASVVLPELVSGQPVQGVVAQGAMNLYKVVVPAGAQFVGVSIVGPDPQFACRIDTTLCPTLGIPNFKDADLYVRHQSRGLPTTGLYDCRSLDYGTNDACIFSNELNGAGLQSTLAQSPVGPEIKSFLGPGKYFVGIRGYAGPAEYVAAALVA